MIRTFNDSEVVCWNSISGGCPPLHLPFDVTVPQLLWTPLLPFVPTGSAESPPLWRAVVYSPCSLRQDLYCRGSCLHTEVDGPGEWDMRSHRRTRSCFAACPYHEVISSVTDHARASEVLRKGLSVYRMLSRMLFFVFFFFFLLGFFPLEYGPKTRTPNEVAV